MTNVDYTFAWLIIAAKIALGFALAIVAIFGAFIALMVLAVIVIMPGVLLEQQESFPADYDAQDGESKERIND